jgi:hypothetical protein
MLRECRKVSREYCLLLRKWTDPKPRPAKVSLDDLFEEFQKRMNPPFTLSPNFNGDLYEAHKRDFAGIPQRTIDVSPTASFCRPFSVDDFIW